MSARVFIGLGSNLAEPAQQLKTALSWFDQHSAIAVQQCSPIYQSPALQLPGATAPAPDYLNAVVEIGTELAAEPLLSLLKQQEAAQGRDFAAQRWSSRPLDLDILWFAGQEYASDTLSLPHPGIAERDFVLLPWHDIAPNIRIPRLGTVADCLISLTQQSGELTARRIAQHIDELCV